MSTRSSSGWRSSPRCREPYPTAASRGLQAEVGGADGIAAGEARRIAAACADLHIVGATDRCRISEARDATRPAVDHALAVEDVPVGIPQIDREIVQVAREGDARQE